LPDFGCLGIDERGASQIREFFQRGLRWGVAGAFVYVLTDFGTRLFRNDLTVGAATWAIITLIAGPALAVVLSLAWKMKPAADSAWQIGAVLFFAGLAPRRVLTVVENVALSLLKAQSTTTTTKVTPLTSLRGITPEIAARLREENIDDVSALAYADPIRLVQSLPYDLRQVINWIDQAQLATVLPKQYDTLTERGVTGAIDLAWRWLHCSLVEDNGKEFIRPIPDKAPPTFVMLANTNDADARLVYEAAAQLFYEEQVCLLWVMYNSFSTTGGTVGQDTNRNRDR
jgi:predicted flap endonuclease-1-like 5' DNA nuclease